MAMVGRGWARPSDLYSSHLPRNFEIPSFVLRRVFTAVPPTKMRTFGLISSIWRSIKGKHASNSCWVGWRLPAGRQKTVFEIYKSFSLSNPAHLKAWVKSWPLMPTKGLPCRSSSAPGASPTSIRGAFGLPSEKTRFRAVFFKEHPSKESSIFCKSSRECTWDKDPLFFDVAIFSTVDFVRSRGVLDKISVISRVVRRESFVILETYHNLAV